MSDQKAVYMQALASVFGAAKLQGMDIDSLVDKAKTEAMGSNKWVSASLVTDVTNAIDEAANTAKEIYKNQ